MRFFAYHANAGWPPRAVDPVPRLRDGIFKAKMYFDSHRNDQHARVKPKPGICPAAALTLLSVWIVLASLALLGAAGVAHATSQSWNNGFGNFSWNTSFRNWGWAAWAAGNGTLTITSGACNIDLNHGAQWLNDYGSARTIHLGRTGVLSVNTLGISQGTGFVNLNGGTLLLNRFNSADGAGRLAPHPGQLVRHPPVLVHRYRGNPCQLAILPGEFGAIKPLYKPIKKTENWSTM